MFEITTRVLYAVLSQPWIAKTTAQDMSHFQKSSISKTKKKMRLLEARTAIIQLHLKLQKLKLARLMEIREGRENLLKNSLGVEAPSRKMSTSFLYE